MRIAHLSDIHLGKLENIRPWRFIGKRLTGGLNLLLYRGATHDNAVAKQALREIVAHAVDHVIITGDLSNMAFESEFAAARTLLAPLEDRLSVVPGNHDYYTYGSVRKRRFESFFADWMRSDLPNGDATYPYVKLLGGVAIVGVNSSIPSPPTFAVGRVDSEQLASLQRLLASKELVGRFVIAALHHHLVSPRVTSYSKEFFRELRNHREVTAVLLEGGVDLVVHGHNHQYGVHALGRPDGGRMIICEAGSASIAQHRNEIFAGKYNVYQLSKAKSGALALEKLTTYLYRGDRGTFVPWQEVEPSELPTRGTNQLE